MTESALSQLGTILYTPDAVAKALSLTTHWLEEAARKREINHTRVGRRLLFTRTQIDALVRAHAVSAAIPGEFVPALPKRPSAGKAADGNSVSTELRNLRPKKPRHSA